MNSLKNVIIVSLALIFIGCKENKPKNEAQPEPSFEQTQEFIKSIEYSNLKDKATQEEVEEALKKAGVKKEHIVLFLEDVNNFNETIGEVGLVNSGFVQSNQLKPSYDLVELHNHWQEKYPLFPGNNCRLTTFGLLKDYVKISHPSVDNTENLFIDKDALQTSSRKMFSEKETENFMTLFSKIPTEEHNNIDKHVEKVKSNWQEKGITFIHKGEDEKASFIFVFFHSAISPEDVFLFIGHAGVLLPYKENKLMFIEKLAFEEPYQALIFNNRTQVNDYLMNRYDVEWGQPTAKPFILENDELLEGYRPNANNLGLE